MKAALALGILLVGILVFAYGLGTRGSTEKLPPVVCHAFPLSEAEEYIRNTDTQRVYVEGSKAIRAAAVQFDRKARGVTYWAIAIDATASTVVAYQAGPDPATVSGPVYSEDRTSETFLNFPPPADTAFDRAVEAAAGRAPAAARACLQ